MNENERQEVERTGQVIISVKAKQRYLVGLLKLFKLWIYPETGQTIMHLNNILKTSTKDL